MKHLKVDHMDQNTESGAGPPSEPKETGTGTSSVPGLARKASEEAPPCEIQIITMTELEDALEMSLLRVHSQDQQQQSLHSWGTC